MTYSSLLALALTALTPLPQTPSTDEPVVVVATTAPSPAPPPRLKPRPKPEVKVVCTPRMPMSGGTQAAIVTCTVHISNPDEQLWCPRVDWYVGEQFNGGQESDCTPYETVISQEGNPPDFWTEDGQPRRIPLWKGVYRIKAKLMKSGKVVGVGEFLIEVF